MGAAYSSVLLVEGDPSAREALEHALLREGLEPICAEALSQAEALLATRRPRLIILDPRLAPDDGWSVLRRLRRHGGPLLLLVPQADAATTRLAFRLGADDCVALESGAGEVAARARFVLQRSAEDTPNAPAFGEIALDPALGAARVGGRTVALTRSEYYLLAALVEARGRVVSREQLVIRARAHAAALPLLRSVEAHVRSLRRKLGDDLQEPRLLLAVRGFGYRLASTSPAPATGFAEAAFQAMIEPAMVIDDQQRVKLMNQAAEALVGKPAEIVVEHLTCSDLLMCRAHNTGRPCPWLAAMESCRLQQAELVICPQGKFVAVQETITPLPGEPAHWLLEVQQRRHD